MSWDIRIAKKGRVGIIWLEGYFGHYEDESLNQSVKELESPKPPAWAIFFFQNFSMDPKNRSLTRDLIRTKIELEKKGTQFKFVLNDPAIIQVLEKTTFLETHQVHSSLASALDACLRKLN